VADFDSFVCIDWSGQAVARPKGLAVATCDAGAMAPALLRPQGGWSREGLAEWLLGHAAAGTRMIVGLDLSPALPFVDRGGYFPGIPGSPGDAISLWALVEELCATEPHLAASGLPLMPRYADHFRSQIGRQTVTGAAFGQGAGRFRVVEHRQKAQRVNPVSCFNLVGAAQVGKSSLTGMRMLHRLRGHLPVWPFDPLPAKGPVIVEIYTAIAARAAGLRRGLSKIRTMAELNLALGQLGSPPVAGSGAIDDHSADALLTAAWLRAHGHDNRDCPHLGLDLRRNLALRRTPPSCSEAAGQTEDPPSSTEAVGRQRVPA
jgi:hypothetical protein